MTVKIRGEQLGSPFYINGTDVTISGVLNASFTTGLAGISAINTTNYGLTITDDAANLGFPVNVPLVGLTIPDTGVMFAGNMSTSTPEAILQVMPSGFGPDTPSIELAVDDTGYDNTFATRVGASTTYAYVKRSIAASPDSYNALSVASDFVSLVTADGPMSINSVDNLSLSGASSVDITAVSSNIVLSGVDITTSGTGNIIVATYGNGSTASTLDLNVDGGFGTVFGSIAQSNDNDLPRVGLIVDNTGDINLGSLVDRDTNNQGGGGGGGGGPSNIDWYANSFPDPIQNCDGTLSYDLGLVDAFGYHVPILIPHGDRTQAETFLAGIGIQADALTWYSNDGGNTASPGPVLISVGAGQSYIADVTPLTAAGGSFSSTPALTYSGGAYNGNQWTATYNGNTYDTILLGPTPFNGWFIIPAMSGGGGGGGGGSGPVNFVTSLISAENGSAILGVKNQGIARVAVGSWWNSATADHGLHIVSNGFSRGFDIGGSDTTAYQTDETALLVPVSGTMFMGSKDSSAIYISPALGVIDSNTNFNIDHGLYLYNGSSGNNAGVVNKLVVPEGTPFAIGATALAGGYVEESLSFLPQGLGYGGNPSINLGYSEGYSSPKDNSLSVVLTSGNFLVDVHTDTYATNSHMALSNNGIGDFHVYVASNDQGSPSIRGVFSLAESDTYTGTMAASIGVELVDGMPTNAIVVSVSGIDMYSGVNVAGDLTATGGIINGNLLVDSPHTQLTGTESGVEIAVTHEVTASGTTDFTYALNATTTALGSGRHTNVASVLAAVHFNGSGTAVQALALDTVVAHHGSSTIDTLYGGNFAFELTDAGGASNALAVQITAPTYSSTGRIGTNMGLYVANQGHAGQTASSAIVILDQSGSSVLNNSIYAYGGKADFNVSKTAAADFNIHGQNDDNAFYMDVSADSLGIGTATPSSKLHVVKDDATTNSVVDILTLTHSTTGTAADGIGTGLAFYSEDASGNIDQAGRINCKFPTAAHATQTGQMDLAALNTTLLSLFTGATAADNRITLGAHTNYQSYVPFFTEYDNGNSGATKTFDWNNGVKQKVTMTATCSGMFTAPPGPCNLTLFITQGGSGSYTMTWPEAVKWPGGVAPSLSTAVSSIDIIAFYYNGTDYYGTASLGFA